MICEYCNTREATVFFEQSINGESKAMHLCHVCAAKLKGEGVFKMPDLFHQNFFGDLFGIATPERVEKKTCPQCGASFADIRREGKVCCPGCYAAFEKELSPTVRSLHGNVTHTGRAPVQRRAKRDKEAQMRDIRTRLQAAVAAEQYEQAAQLRDELRNLEKEGK